MSDLQTITPTTLAPTTLAEAIEFSERIAHSEIVPKDYRGKPENVLVAVQWGMEIGLAPMQAMQNIAVINGRPSIWGDAMLALCQAHTQWNGIDETVDDNGATCTVRRSGSPDITRTFTMEDAKRAGLAGKQGPWTHYPRRMLQMRARSWALRDGFADALKGIISAEEAQDMPREKDMGPAEVVDKKADAAEKVKAKLAAPKNDQPDLVPPPTIDEVLAALGNCQTPELLADIKQQARAVHPTLTQGQKAMLTKSINAAEEELTGVDINA